MKRLALLAALAATAVTALAVLASSGGAQSGERTIVLTQPAGGFEFVDVMPPLTRRGRPSPGAWPGDHLISTHPLVDAAKRRAGRLEQVCTAVHGSRSIDRAVFLCTWVAHLADGDLFLVARFRPPRPEPASTVRGALTGGTAAYAGARGTFTSTTGVPSRRGVPYTHTFHILP
jgi:hypothetical protein